MLVPSLRNKLIGVIIFALVISSCRNSMPLSQQATRNLPTPTIERIAAAGDDEFLDRLAADTWGYLSSDWAVKNHLPWSWRSATAPGGDYANPAEIGFYALSWIAAYEFQRPWSPGLDQAEAEVEAVLDQLIAWQTGSQAQQPNGPNAFQNSAFYQWYWISQDPPVVGAGNADHLVPAVDNAWLAASLIAIREFAEDNNHPVIVQKTGQILASMDFRIWYHPDTYRFSWGDAENPQGGTQADYYSNENRIINFVARSLGHLSTEEFLLSLSALERPAGSYHGIPVEIMAWDGSYFTYLAPALFINEMKTPYGTNTINPVTQAHIAYAINQGYSAWGFSDCYDTGMGDYIQQGSPPAAMPDPPETKPGLISPHASALTLITSFEKEAALNLQNLATTFPTLYQTGYGFKDSVMANPIDPDYGGASERFSALNQEWIFLAIANAKTGLIWKYFYQDEGVLMADGEMFSASFHYLPLIHKNPF